jgi:hypothetical protein
MHQGSIHQTNGINQRTYSWSYKINFFEVIQDQLNTLLDLTNVATGTEGGTTDWNSRTEQRERPKRDRLIASPVRAELLGARDVKRKCYLELCL